MEEHGIGLGREKQVGYIELIYDLIFVYLVGRNNALLQAIQDGFIRPSAFLTSLVSALVVLQIWYYSTLFTNRYGDRTRAEYVGLFINMYLLYHMADGIRVDWGAYFARYHTAWALILVNMAVQHGLRIRRPGVTVWEKVHLKKSMVLLLSQAGVVLLMIPIYLITGASLTFWALLFGILATLLTRQLDELFPVDFSHLTERVMLYVVFTFGEMIVAIAGYFENGVDFGGIYFSLMAFGIVVGLFLSYGFLYEHILDREQVTAGIGYMMIHIFLLAALNFITAAMELMQMARVETGPKTAFLAASFLIYYFFLFSTRSYAKMQFPLRSRFVRNLLVIAAVFVALTALCYRNAWISIALSVLFVYGVYFTIVREWNVALREQGEHPHSNR